MANQPRVETGKAREKSRAFPESVPIFSSILAALSVGAAAASLAMFDWPQDIPWPLVAPFLALLVASAYLIVRFRYKDEVEALELYEAALAPVMVVFPGAMVIVLVALTTTISNLLHRNHPIKSFFNVAQWTFAAGVGSIVYDSLKSGRDFTAANGIALLVAMVCVGVLNQLAFSYVIHLSQRRPLRQVLAGLKPVIVPAWIIGWGVNWTFGLLFAASFQWSRAAIALFFVPLAVLYWAARGHAAVLADTSRLEGMQRATHALVAPVNPRDAIAQFLGEVRSSFDAETAELVLIEDGARMVYRVEAEHPEGLQVTDQDPQLKTLAAQIIQGGVPVRLLRDSESELGSQLQEEGWLDCLAAPLVTDEGVMGALCAYNLGGMEGFEEGEFAVIQALAAEIAGALRKAALLDSIFEERRKLSEIVNHTSDGILTIEPDGTIVTWNPGMERISGFPADQMAGKPIAASLSCLDESGERVPLENWADPNTVLPSTFQIVTVSQQIRQLSCSYAKVSDVSDRPELLVIVARDETKAHELRRLKDDLVSTVSHELRTPLTPLKGWAEILVGQGERLDLGHAKEGVRAILDATNRLEELIMNLLEASRIEQSSSFSTGEVDVLSVVRRVTDEFANAHSDRAVVLEATGPAGVVRGDELGVERILSNLLSNAIQYAPGPEPITIKVWGSDHQVEIDVIDRGPGIPAEEQERIFERFHRLGDYLTRATSGVGLGLFIARRFAQDMGGTLTATNTPGGGATFRLKLQAVSPLVKVG